ncbi:unnamed protein product, partial [Allacma fusca]
AQRTHMIPQNVVVNLTAIRSEGYSFHNIHCCYRAISRVEQTLDKYDDQADSVILVSKDCVPLDKEDVVYRDHHALVQKNYRKSTAKKVHFWNESKSRKQKPPNVLLIGIDSMSKLNFQRTMPSTRKFLKNIGAVEMLGYTKVGENTFPNVVAFLSGLNESSLEKACYFTPLTAQDACPYIWKEFNEAQYITAHLEDSPELNAFNRLKTGFVQQQVDFYMRPFMQNIFGRLHSKDCAGPDTIEQKIFSFINNIENMSETNGIPYFVFTWLTGLSHSDMSAATHSDDIFTAFLKNLNLSDTILFFMSDHGFRYGTFRETFFGWFEDKLPNFWVYLPPKLQSEFPLWGKELKLNSRKLLSPFDLYQTFRHVLQYFSSGKANKLEREKNVLVERTYGSSMFASIPTNRTCSDASIAPHFCPCATPKQIPMDSPELLSAVRTALNYINALLPRQCSHFSLKKITAGAVMTMTDGSSGSRDYVLAFITNPGSFLFEATVNCSSTRECKIKGNVLRMNKISTDVSCVHTADLQMLCYCTSR